MPFKNYLVAGTVLKRAAIQSPNFLTGVSGWTINRDGSAEFYNAVFRGALQVGVPPAPYLLISGTVPAAVVTFYATNWAGTVAAFSITMAVDANNYHYEVLLSASSVGIAHAEGFVVAGGASETVIHYVSGGVTISDYGVFTSSRVRMFGENLLGDPTQPGSDMLWGNTSLPRGITIGGYNRLISFSFTSTAVVAEQLAGSLGTYFLPNGRAYGFELKIQIKSAAAQAPVMNIRKTNLAGALLIGGRMQISRTAVDLDTVKTGIFVNTSGADVTTAIALTCQPEVPTAVVYETGTGGNSGAVRIWDLGAAADYSGSPSV